MKFQTTSPILLKSSNSLALTELTCLLEIYFAMNFKKSLIFLVLDAMCLIKPWSEIGWKLLSQISEFIGALESYGNRILINTLSLFCTVSPHVGIEVGCFLGTH